MAEILLSLTIIGVVAAITLPSLTGNINERTWNTQRKALYARMSQAIALMPALNGYGTLTGTISEDGTQTITADNVAETFVTAGLSKVLKINNICDSNHISDCGLPETFTNLAGSGNIAMPKDMGELNPLMIAASYDDTLGTGSHKALNTKAAAFETQNGESILLFYNPHCVSHIEGYERPLVQTQVCVNMVYDLNGNKGPNTVGKDIGVMTVLDPTDSAVVAPVPFNKIFSNVSTTTASTFCTEKTGSESRIPTRSELISLFVNNPKMFGLEDTTHHWVASNKMMGPDGKLLNLLLTSQIGQFRTNDNTDTTSWSSFCIQR